MGRPNNVILLRCSGDSFFRMWVEFLTPYHHMTDREKDVAAKILAQRDRIAAGCGGNEVMTDELLWTQTSRGDMRASLGMSRPYFQVMLGNLRRKGFLRSGTVNARFIPHTEPGANPFELRVIFDRGGMPCAAWAE